MTSKGRSADTDDLFIEGSGQLRLVGKSVEQQALEKGKVECLGMRFDSEDARRSYFTQKLIEKLADPEFRRTPGFPLGSDDDIIRMSDPPYHTACPNPSLADFMLVYGRPYDPEQRYQRDPFAVDTSVGKTDALYKAHGYHTKVPHLAIVPSILHYTDPGDVVLDGFCGSGMTGVAAKWCSLAPAAYRLQLEKEWSARGQTPPLWGDRAVVLNDLSPAATFISSNHCLPFDSESFSVAASALLRTAAKEIGWMYETLHSDRKTKGRINFTVWSDVFACPECSGEINYLAEALDDETQGVRTSFKCPHCDSDVTRRSLERVFETAFDQEIGKPFSRPKKEPVLINYTVSGKAFEKKPDVADLELIRKTEGSPSLAPFPTVRMMHAPEDAEKWGDEWRAGVAAFAYIHHAYLPRALKALGFIWQCATRASDHQTQRHLIYFVEQAVWGMSLMARYAPTHYSQVNQYMSGRIRTFSLHAECSPWYILEGKASRLKSTFRGFPNKSTSTIVSTGTCARIGVPDGSIDYIFTDPPFGFNFAYAELNFIIEAWHRVFTDAKPEAIVSEFQHKGVLEYQDLMRSAFTEYYRVLKPGRWITVVFSNSSNAIWRAIQEAMGMAGFIIADVRTLDKQQGTFNQVLGISVKQDLVISAYRPSGALEKQFSIGQSSPEAAWAFVSEHLLHVPVFSTVGESAEIIGERTQQMLFDRMVAFHVQRQLSIPFSTAEFLVGLSQRYPERDGMYFLATQVAEYDRKRNTATELRQLSLFVTDEASAIQWVRRELQQKPRSFQDLQPAFMREIQNWAKHEQTVELKEILRQNCLHYDGAGPVPSQIHSYLSSNFKELRSLAKDDTALVAKAMDRWYVPDPSKQIDLEKLREKSLLSEFEAYKTSKERKLKLFRSEAVRAGFKAAYDRQDYKTIVSITAKLPENVLQEDEKLLMYYDVASMRLGDE
jgi:16S rRNA G966 N2-methylase RsmD